MTGPTIEQAAAAGLVPQEWSPGEPIERHTLPHQETGEAHYAGDGCVTTDDPVAALQAMQRQAIERHDCERCVAMGYAAESLLARAQQAEAARPSPWTGWFVQGETRQLLWASTIDLIDEPVTPLAEWIEHQNAAVRP